MAKSTLSIFKRSEGMPNLGESIQIEDSVLPGNTKVITFTGHVVGVYSHYIRVYNGRYAQCFPVEDIVRGRLIYQRL